MAVRDQHGRRSRRDVVVRAHRERVGAGGGDGQQVAAPRLGELHPADEHLLLAVLARDRVRAGRGLVRAVGEERRVARAVEHRPRIVGHPAVDCDHVGGLARGLDRADAVESHARPADERAAGLEHDLGRGQAVERKAPLEAAEQLAHELLDARRLLVGDVAHAEAAAEVDDRGRPVELRPAGGCEARKPVDRHSRRGRVQQLRADVDVQAGDVEPRLGGGRRSPAGPRRAGARTSSRGARCGSPRACRPRSPR